MNANIYVIEETLTTQEWFYKGEQVNWEVIQHVCHARGTTTVPDNFLARFPDVKVKNVEQHLLIGVSTFCYTGSPRAEFEKEKDGFVFFVRRASGEPWGVSWKFPVKRRTGNLVVLEKTAGEYRDLYWGNDPKVLEVDRPWKSVNPLNPLNGFEGNWPYKW